ncbi:hypothetical protein BAE44_0010253 [Dichanthelium oligosanthes]|uniref:Disease resistance protein RPM1 n=1 Tax=Dichanthelium oligosanthes TaxID=888268 RepID=A0A1E5VUC9_9POAL|nr:hypothetical protein BAE44_0010253 [Dichanthelium oligosanthes]
MRQCFLYCSVFPECYLIEKLHIAQHWISEGFIEKKRKYALEEIAEDYFDELIGRGLLQLEFGSDGMARARMPSIIRSFAKYLSDHENFCNDLISAHKFYEGRRLSIVGNTEANMWDIKNVNSDKNFSVSARLCGIVGGNKANHNNEEVTNSSYNGSGERIDEIVENNEPNDHTEAVDETDINNGGSKRLRSMKSLRTIILCNSNLPKGILGVISKLTLPRVLDLHMTDIEVLPSSIERLEHLRYLNMSDTRIITVPETIGSLTMLQYLLLKNCKLSKFPNVIQKLRNLRSIDISGTGLDDIRWKFDHVQELSLSVVSTSRTMLKFLAIAGFHQLGNLSAELRNEQMVAFPKLEQLQLSKMKVLHSFLDIKGQHLPCIRRICVLNCPKLTTIPRYLKKSVTLVRFEIDEESRVGVKKMVSDFRVGIVLIVGNQRQEVIEADEDNIAEAGNDEPVIVAEASDQNFDDVGDNAAPAVQPNGHARCLVLNTNYLSTGTTNTSKMFQVSDTFD